MEKQYGKKYSVVAKVISQMNSCPAGHKVGDEFVIGTCAPANLCGTAFCGMFPFATVLRFGGSIPWEREPDRCAVACPDPEHGITFELRRLPEPVELVEIVR